MTKNLKQNIKGFTIIEVLIVLAIAGLIMLIVFLAVPALQRNSRNTQAKNAASAILGGVSEFSNNNNGVLPTAITVTGSDVAFTGAAGSTPSNARIQGGYTVATGTAMPATTATGSFVVNINHKCTGNAFATTSSPRAVAIGYNIETSNGTAPQCVES
ncbi:MAG: hypothetical protein JWL85_437 [Candidatus Saccharibacteria bacterium]|nr:hypothetical protein [Candidatus Saccharibacteria bacterium]